MFSLIITIIAIVLVAALAIATLYHGGDAFSEGSTQAAAASVINQAQQIAGAGTMYKVKEDDDAADVQALVDDDYLSSEPTLSSEITEEAWVINDPDGDGNVGDTDTGFVTVTGVSEKVCEKINEEAGEENPVTVDLEDDDPLNGLPYACDTEGNDGDFAYRF